VNILFTGRGTSGSWKIRGEQLGSAFGARVLREAKEFRGFDAAVVIKRPDLAQVLALRREGVPVIWDVVDAWPQPHGNDWDRTTCMAWAAGQMDLWKPVGIVAATRQMELDFHRFGIPTLWLPHHPMAGMPLNPIRPSIVKIGYQGGSNYLGHWDDRLRRYCSRKGIQWINQAVDLADLDVVVGLRAQSGYAPAHWKSNVKLANAHASGTPAILSPEAGYRETASGHERWATNEVELLEALSDLESPVRRRIIQRGFLDARLDLPTISTQYREWVRSILWK